MFRSFWKNLNNWVFENTQIELQFKLEHILFGILDKTEEKKQDTCWKHWHQILQHAYFVLFAFPDSTAFSRFMLVNTNASDFKIFPIYHHTSVILFLLLYYSSKSIKASVLILVFKLHVHKIAPLKNFIKKIYTMYLYF